MKLEFAWLIFEKTQISNFTKIRPVAAKLFHADRMPDRHVEASSSPSKLCERPLQSNRHSHHTTTTNYVHHQHHSLPQSSLQSLYNKHPTLVTRVSQMKTNIFFYFLSRTIWCADPWLTSRCVAISFTVTRRFSFTMISTAAMASGVTTRCAWAGRGESITELMPFMKLPSPLVHLL